VVVGLKKQARSADPIWTMGALTHPVAGASDLGSTADVARQQEITTPFYRVSVKALVFDADRRLLVVQEQAGHWELPGGGWEHGESLEQCLARELREELDARLASVDLSTQRAWVGPGASGRYHRLKLSVHATLASPFIKARDEILAARWVTPPEFAGLRVALADEPLREYVLAEWPLRAARAS
jgi:8-oxo-dGTP pyrophosphatase MutT (NUDIX family)